MYSSRIAFGLWLLFNLSFLQCSGGQGRKGSAATGEALKLVATIPLPGVSGRIDHLAYDTGRQVLYVAALGNNTVEVADIRSKKVIQTIKGLAEPQGIQYIPGSDVIFVANGDNGVCNVFSAGSYEQVGSVKLAGDADNVRYDAAAGKIYVGYGSGGIAVIDAASFRLLEEVELPGHPESFQADYASGKLFVNIPGARLVAVIDLESGTVESEWKLEDAGSNFPMALDTAGQRLFIGCRHPARLLVIDSETGRNVTSLDIDGDADDVFYDGTSRQVYVSCGGGYVDVFRQVDRDSYESLPPTETQAGARTSLYLPELDRLFVAAPARSGNKARLLVYERQ